MMSSGATSAMTMMKRRRDITINLLSSIPGIFGWIAVHVHANRVATQLQIMLHKVLVLQLAVDEISLTSNEETMVSLQLDSEAQANGTHSMIAMGRSIMVELRAYRCSASSSRIYHDTHHRSSS